MLGERLGRAGNWPGGRLGIARNCGGFPGKAGGKVNAERYRGDGGNDGETPEDEGNRWEKSSFESATRQRRRPLKPPLNMEKLPVLGVPTVKIGLKVPESGPCSALFPAKSGNFTTFFHRTAKIVKSDTTGHR